MHWTYIRSLPYLPLVLPNTYLPTYLPYLPTCTLPTLLYLRAVGVHCRAAAGRLSRLVTMSRKSGDTLQAKRNQLYPRGRRPPLSSVHPDSCSPNGTGARMCPGSGPGLRLSFGEAGPGRVAPQGGGKLPSRPLTCSRLVSSRPSSPVSPWPDFELPSTHLAYYSSRAAGSGCRPRADQRLAALHRSLLLP